MNGAAQDSAGDYRRAQDMLPSSAKVIPWMEVSVPRASRVASDRLVTITKVLGRVGCGFGVAHFEPYSGSGLAIALEEPPPVRPEPEPRPMAPKGRARLKAALLSKAKAAEPVEQLHPKRVSYDLRNDNPRREGETMEDYAWRIHELMRKAHEEGRLKKMWSEATVRRELNRR
jgi:hypothetical protein